MNVETQTGNEITSYNTLIDVGTHASFVKIVPSVFIRVLEINDVGVVPIPLNTHRFRSRAQLSLLAIGGTALLRRR